MRRHSCPRGSTASKLRRVDEFSAGASVAHLTSVEVVAAETRLRDQLTTAAAAPEAAHPDVTQAAADANLDTGQSIAAAAVASADPLVVVEGAGKTTMLGVALTVAAEHGRASRVVAPTLRAAQVAHAELGVPATSVAALVHAHGWRWNADGVWTRLTVGDTDPDTGRIYSGPPRDTVLAKGERVIVDEAGMLDQDTAHALLTITAEAAATVALVGDRAQLPAVGRSGVLDMAAETTGRTYDMSELHRSTDPEYAELTLAMRDRENPGDAFDQLAAMQLVTLHEDADHVREHITEQAQEGEAITVATNDEVAAVNERIRAGKVERGEVDDQMTATGSDGLSIGAGDLIQTRQNDTTLGVANRQQWVVQHVTDDGTVYAREHSAEHKPTRTVGLPAEYVCEHAHLSYASTAYGVQGATVDAAHTILSEATSAAGVYVGMTRGREMNRLHIVAEDLADAKAQFIEAMRRDPADRGLAHATAQAAEAVEGLVAEGPVKTVTDEITRLTTEAAKAEREAKRWEQIAERLDTQRATHRAEDDRDADALQQAENVAAKVRAEVVAPLDSAAEAAGAEYLTAVEREDAARDRFATAGRFGRRKARAEHRTATENTQATRVRVSEQWGEPPESVALLNTWATTQANRRAGADPRVLDATHAVETATAAQQATGARHGKERMALLVREYGAEHVRRDPARARITDPHRNAETARTHAERLRSEADELQQLPAKQAAARIDAKHAAEEAQRAKVERQQQRRDPFANDPSLHDPRRSGRGRSL